ncbi:MAG: hypothetical protein ACO1RX_21000, partial [Candidatus Sericytochromatia bacterium]
DDGQLKDASGVTRDAADEGAFKLTDGNFEFYYEFSIDTDEDEPQVDSINATIGTSSDGDNEIEVEFSEPMAFFTRSDTVMGMNDESPLELDNYHILIVDAGDPNPSDSAVIGSPIRPDDARFDSDDETNSTVLLELDNTIDAGDRVYVYVDNNVVDPAGNSVDSANDIEDDAAN